MSRIPRTAIVFAPFGLVEFPHLGSSLVKAAAEARGFPCDVIYASVEFAGRIGFTEYLTLERAACPMLLPERPFAGLLSDRIPSIERYYSDLVEPFGEHLWVYIRNDRQSRIAAESMHGIEQCAREYIEELVQRPVIRDADIVAFSSSYGQHTASLAIARRVKETYPDKRIVFGGANCEGAMGRQLVHSFPFVDYAFSGDGDVSYPLFLEALRDGRPVELPGVFARGGSRPGEPVPRPLTRLNMDALPLPDYSDYFEALERQPDGRNWCMGIPIEGSRGCWWGEKHHCTFCGLNGMGMEYRAKSPERFRDELRTLVERHDRRDVMASDNILDLRWLKGLLPELARDRAHDVLFFEIKANLRREDLTVLADAGVTHLQPGIESLSTHVLELMDKGTTSLQNVQLLKWAEELGMTITWNVLCGLPGEKPEDYAQMAELMQKIPHLQPPAAFARISIDRFSPYFDHPDRYGIRIQPSDAYRYVYDLPDDEIRELAYWYSYDCENGSSRESLSPPPYASHAQRLRAIWGRLYEKVRFCYELDGDGCAVLTDERPSSPGGLQRLDALQTALLLACDASRSRAGLLRALDVGEPGAPDEDAFQAALDALEAAWALHREGDRYLSLCTRAELRPKAPPLGDRSLVGL